MSGLFEGLIGHFASKSGKKARRQNLRFKQHLQVRRSMLQRRQFVRQARGAIAQNMVAAGARAGGLDSSGFQGAQASLQTQREEGLFRADIEQQIIGDIGNNEVRMARNEDFAAQGAVVGSIMDTMISSEMG